MLKVTVDGRALSPGPERDFYLSVSMYYLIRLFGGFAFFGTVVYLWWKS